MPKIVDVAQLSNKTKENNEFYNAAIRMMDEAEKSNDPLKIEEAKKNFDQVCKDYVYNIMSHFVTINKYAPFDRDFYIDLMNKIQIEGKPVPEYIGISSDEYKGENGLKELVSSAKELSETAITNVKSISGYHNYVAMNPIDIAEKEGGKASRVKYSRAVEGVDISLKDLADIKQKQEKFEEKGANIINNSRSYEGTMESATDAHIDIKKLSQDLYDSLKILRMDGESYVTEASEELKAAAAQGENEAVYSLVTKLKDRCENYQFQNSSFSSKTYLHESRTIFDSLKSLTRYQDQVNAERRQEGLEEVFEKYHPMTNYCSTQYNNLDSDKNISMVMFENDDEQFLMKLTNTTSPAKAVARLGNLYMSSSRIASGSRPVGCLGVEGLKSISERLEIDGVDLNEEKNVKEAVKTAAGALRNAIADENNHFSIYAIRPKTVNQMIDLKSGEKKPLYENYSFKEVVNEEAMQEYRTITHGFAEKKANDYEVEFNNLLNDISFSSKGGKTREYEAFTKQADTMKNIGTAKSAEEIKKNIDKMIEVSKKYIIAKRGQKKFSPDIDILDEQTNNTMSERFRTKRGKKRYESALAIYKSMTELKERVSKAYHDDLVKTYQKQDVTKAAENADERVKVGTSIFNDISKDFGKTSKEAGENKGNQKKVTFGEKTK